MDNSISRNVVCKLCVAHWYGDRPFRKNIKPVENKWVSLLTIGEGWHNWHHTYPYDYACSDEGIFLRRNPTKLFIDILGWFGQTYDHKRKILRKINLLMIQPYLLTRSFDMIIQKTLYHTMICFQLFKLYETSVQALHTKSVLWYSCPSITTPPVAKF